MSIYEVHLGSWRRDEDDEWLTYRELADQLVTYVVDMGYTHIELMPVAEHPFDGSWGYQVTGYYAATSRYGSPQDFMYLVDQCHQSGIGVILDWVPAHFPKDGWALSYYDGTHLYSHEDPRQGEHPDWGTYIFNYGRNEVRNFLIANAVYWMKEFHIDGLRVDAVSSMIYLDFSREDGQWIANQYGSNENLAAIDFLKEANAVIHAEAPGAITIAEESTAWPMVSRPTYVGGLGFTFKWNMGWMHDTLFYMQKDPVYRRYDHNKLTFSLMYAFSENFVLSLSHDEVVHGKGSLMGKMPGDWWQKFASLRLLFGYQYTHPGKKLNFMGAEIAQWAEWSEARNLDWHLLDFETHSELQRWVRDLNKLYKNEAPLYELDVAPEGFEWIEANDAENSVFSYIRYARDREDFIVVVCNFTPVIRYNYRIGVPESGFYEELLNSDAEFYGGGNIGNEGGRHSEPWHWHNFEHSMSLTLPPLSIVLLKKQR
ncbi:MAG: 1,4-alpha-glucan branching protein GlgB, partial [Anaerolineae bacterium]|nr:1,4-alpha-glucan branching protein GlgB [Anaerolineae bacterium]